ncbi:hypothetical protein [Shewanella glacialipiscicola]|uniref:hypothetical protein n=1 Tax=Shewanella glacialipiscicola TaxID=614069 RepID=UPI003D7A74D1
MTFETISLGTQPAGTGGDTARTAFEKVNRNFLAADVLAAAMSQAQFDAIREQNKERYAASGWVSFGNHESGKQVNECKPGLYTALTMPNTLLIGKSGGVGGSKTDNASVHIDGVIFNLTNQFVLTLPTHPTSILPERMDMYGVESEIVEISSASPNAYQGGLRSVGATVNLFTATDQQKKDFFSQNSNTTYIGSDGKIYQWQLYKVAFAGTTGGVPSPTEQGYTLNTFGDLWLKAGKNLLYFGNILRLNDGGYHPSHNPFGAAKFVGDTFWHNTATSITSRSDCFNASKLLAGSGSVASGKSGRPEVGGRYYDVIYASGFGGICRDMRYNARRMTPSDYSKADLDVKSGRYRGIDKLITTKIYLVEVTGVGTYLGGSFVLFADNADLFNNADKRYSYFYNVSKNTYGYLPALFPASAYLSTSDVVRHLNNSESAASGLAISPYSGSTVGDFIYIIAGVDTALEIGGEYYQADISGFVGNIYNSPVFSGGWLGGWSGWLTGVPTQEIIGSRKMRAAGVTKTTINAAISWSEYLTNGRNDKNVLTTVNSPDAIALIQYPVFARQTKQASNSRIEGGDNGIGSVFFSSDASLDLGATLGESLLWNVMKESYVNGVSVSQVNLVSNFISPSDSKFELNTTYCPTHTPVTLGAPINGGLAYKALRYNSVENNKAKVLYSATGLKHSSSWGDDSKMLIVNNAAYKTDTNMQSELITTHELSEQIGWT